MPDDILLMQSSLMPKGVEHLDDILIIIAVLGLIWYVFLTAALIWLIARLLSKRLP